MAQLTYHFDASDAGPTDVGGAWGGTLLFAFDDDTGNNCTINSGEAPGLLKGTGTNAPASGPAIISVWARTHEGVWNAPVRLSVPSGGWTWAKVQALHLEYDYDGSNRDANIYDSDGGTLLGNALGDTDTSWSAYSTEIIVKHGIVLPTNAETDLYDIQSDSGANTTLTFDGLSSLDVYYFDASDAGPIDENSDWLDSAYAFDGDRTTWAVGVTATGYLKATGTNAPATGVPIDKVEARWMRYGISTSIPEPWVDLTVPSGDWTWAKIQALHVSLDPGLETTPKIYVSDGGELLATLTKNNTYVYGIQIRVNGYAGHALILASGDDNDVTWTPPHGFTEWYEFNGGSGDDSSIGAWYAPVEDIGFDPSTATVDLVRSGGEELAGVMMLVQGADNLSFRDVAYSESSHAVETDDVDGDPNNILPDSITTLTDGAMTIIQDGARSWAECLSDTITPPAGYTIEGAAGTTSATAAPGRVTSGTGNGDAQVLWMHKTIATAGTETIGYITGITGGNDHKTVTFTIRAKPTLTQADFRLRNDDGSQTAATWLAALNTDATVDAASSDVQMRVRFNINNTAGVSCVSTTDWLIQYSLNDGAWTTLGNSVNGLTNVVDVVASTYLTNGEVTTEQLAGSGIFTAGEVCSSVATSFVADSGMLAFRDTEHEYVINLDATGLADGNTVDLRVVRSNGQTDWVPLTTYTQIPRITIGSTATVYPPFPRRKLTTVRM